jgi:23S rRNA (guanosine2251-2'-O)-methyltransferase
VERRRVGRRPGRERPHLDFDDVVYGIHATAESLAGGERLQAIHVADDRKKDVALRDLIGRAKELGVPVRFEPRTFFARLPMRAHQGIVAISPPFHYASLHEVLTGPARSGKRLYVVLDHLTDPHNVGAIVRTAECGGADAVILPDRRSAGINATVRKVAAGAAAHLPIARVGNVAEAIRAMKKAGIWIAGADAGSGAVPMGQADLDRDLALIIGAEGTGLAPLIRRECDYLVGIPMRGQVGSLNASVAAAVLLYEALRQREPRP